MERLRRILGHTTYVMVMRYVHIDKGDLGKDFDERSPTESLRSHVGTTSGPFQSRKPNIWHHGL